MKTKLFLQIGGIINLFFVAFHLSFWKLFNWEQSLASLSSDDRAVMQVLNIHTAYALAMFALVSLVFSNELSATKLGRIVSLSIAGFWTLRAVNQAVFWGISSIGTWVIVFVCLAIAMLYLIPLRASPDLTN
jgi:hypothetical protein